MGLFRGRMNNNHLKISLCSLAVKGKIAFENSLGFEAQIDGLRLKFGILPAELSGSSPPIQREKEGLDFFPQNY